MNSTRVFEKYDDVAVDDENEDDDSDDDDDKDVMMIMMIIIIPVTYDGRPCNYGDVPHSA